MASPEAKVYRLRGIPAHLDRLGLAQLMKPFLPSGKLEDITVASLALSCDFWSRTPTQTATLTLRSLPDVVRAAPGAGEWQLPVLALPKPLILDDTFFGLTPLNAVAESEHHHDCIVISGLASHPMGSWQPRGNDKSFNWIRDALPELVPGVRFILYGYDTKLVGSKSFQTVPDLAINLINELKTGGWSSPSAKDLAFLAHSLGGVVLKQCLFMLADSGVSYESILGRTKGAIFFGVPSEGMSIEDLRSMLGDQPNKSALVNQISDNSEFLSNLEERITGISRIREMRLFWAYETQTTPTVEFINNTYRRSGPETVLVSRESATGDRCTSDPSSTIQIDASHSEMVKFSSGSHSIGPIANKLRDVVASHCHDLGHDSRPLATRNLSVLANPTITQASMERSSNGHRNRYLDLWSLDEILQSLCAPERDDRLNQIDDSAGCSFEWVFEKPAIGLTNWLQKGEGLYWVSGRPASGKSTFMKFLHNDKRTSQLLRGWYSQSEHVNANFFFHYRGSLVQKSFEGLLRSILSQILEQAPGTVSIFQSILQHQYEQLLGAQSLGSLYADLEELWLANELKLDANTRRDFVSLLECEASSKLFRTIVVQRLRAKYEERIDEKQIEKLVVTHLKDFLASLEKKKLLEACSAICPPDWSSEMENDLRSCLPDWLEAVDLKKKLLKMGGMSTFQRAHPSTQSQAKAKFAQQVEDIVSRHHMRLDVRQSTQHSVWTIDNLEQALSQIINQQAIDLDLCLFLDALDEYDGQPEFIAEFLKEISQQKSSRTRLKILFSSRPWDKFTDAFKDCPGFRIHEHTENDIRELCIHVIQLECPGSRELFLLVEEIVKQAKGVFLWAKLVLLDLSKIASAAVGRGDTRTLSNDLQKALKDLPRDLVEYYSTIVERIPQSFRREAFCLLEVVAKGNYIFLKHIPAILSCLNFSQFSERERIVERIENPDSQALEILLRTYTGGLIEIHRTPPRQKLQLLHQTTVDFIQLPQFKNIMLQSGAHAMNDNGHTFLAKCELLWGLGHGDGIVPLSHDFFEHAKRSEETTGRSLYSFFSKTQHQVTLDDSSPGIRVNELRMPRPLFLPARPTVHIFAAACCANLRLFMDEALQANSQILFEPSACCITAIILSPFLTLSQHEAVQMLEWLASHDFPFENHISCCLPRVFLSLRVTERVPERADPLMLNVVRRFKDPNISFYLPPPGIKLNDSRPTAAVGMLTGAVHMIHLSSSIVTKALLERGANPNVMGQYGHTPLDCYAKSNLGSSAYSPKYVLELMALLVQKGGRLNICDKGEWKSKMEEFKRDGLDVSLFERLGYPKWVKEKKVPFRRSLYKGITHLFRK